MGAAPNRGAGRSLQPTAEGSLPQVRLDCPSGADLDDVKRVCKFVGYFHPPILTRLKLAIEALQKLTRSDGCFLPCGMLVGQLFPNRIWLGVLVEDVEVVPWHKRISREYMSGSRHSSGVGVSFA